MTPVYQTRFGQNYGNCFQACVASLFDLPLEDVPDFCNEEPRECWEVRYRQWLACRGLSLLTIAADDKMLCSNALKGCCLVVAGKKDNGVRHAVIYRDGLLLHNPNKQCEGIIPDCVDIVFPREPK